MQWILIIGGIIYYLYRAYQQEAQKNVNKPLTPVNKPINHGPKQNTTTPQKVPKTLEDVWRELKEAARELEQKPELQEVKTVKPPEKKITSIEYDTMFGREEKKFSSIEYEDNLFRTGVSMDKIPVEEGGSRTMSEITPMMAEYEEKTISKKFFVINGKMLSPKDTFIASMIWERKV